MLWLMIKLIIILLSGIGKKGGEREREGGGERGGRRKIIEKR